MRGETIVTIYEGTHEHEHSFRRSSDARAFMLRKIREGRSAVITGEPRPDDHRLNAAAGVIVAVLIGAAIWAGMLLYAGNARAQANYEPHLGVSPGASDFDCEHETKARQISCGKLQAYANGWALGRAAGRAERDQQANDEARVEAKAERDQQANDESVRRSWRYLEEQDRRRWEEGQREMDRDTALEAACFSRGGTWQAASVFNGVSGGCYRR